MKTYLASFEEALRTHGIDLPGKPITCDRFTRWGKNQRYSAKRIGDGVYFHDFTEQISDIIWFPGRESLLTSAQIKERAS